jgi:hypothetical protein
MKVSIWLCMFVAVLYGAEQDEVTLLRWAGPPGSRPDTYEEWIALHPYTSFSYTLDRFAPGDKRQGSVAILTEQSVFISLTSEIDQLINNLQAEGYTVLSYQISGGEPETLRTFLHELYLSDDIEGALFIGDLPVAWFEIANDFGEYGYAQFPIDLYYMDLNGTWLDTMNTGNGRFDGHTGDLNPEIYIGRLVPPTDPDTLYLKNYLRKDNAYRHDTIVMPQRALVFVDDDWESQAIGWSYLISIAFPDTMNYWNPETTRASVYRVKLDTAQVWVSLFAHSWPGGHQFAFNSGASHDYYYANEYNTQNPPSNFYNFFCCSYCRYTSADYGGGWSIFNPSYGLGAIGSTKTGSMLNFSPFYYPLSQGETLGEAFKNWFTCITDDGVTFDELCWHYGMTLLGDPWLLPYGHPLSIAETSPDIISDWHLTILGNPVSSTLNIMFSLETNSHVNITLYDCTGRKLAHIVDKPFEPGNHSLRYRMIDNAGVPLPQGVYILRAEADTQITVKKIIKI